jgi:predicted enzyme related to lactoylglutathione lyase
MPWPRLLPAVLAAAMVAACATGGSNTPAAAPAPKGSDGRFVWQDLVTTDAAAARRFYGALLGWKFSEHNRGGRPYLIAHTAGGPVGGLVDVRDLKDAGSQWVSYVSVADVDRAVQQVQAAGGRVIVPPTTAAAGRVSVVADPQGAALGLLAPRDAPAEPAQPVSAHFFWREYLAQDAGKALDFYKGLLGYDAASTDARLGLEYFVLRRDRPRAGLFQIPATAGDVRPNWLPYVLVADPATMAAKAKGLGGRVLVEPSPDRRNGTLAVVADPTGAAVALQKYPL